MSGVWEPACVSFVAAGRNHGDTVVSAECEIVNAQLVVTKVVDEGGVQMRSGDRLEVVTATELTVTPATHKVEISMSGEETSVTTTANDLGDLIIEVDALGSVEG